MPGRPGRVMQFGDALRRGMPAIVGYALTLVFFGLLTGRVNDLFFGARLHEVFSAYAHAAEVGQFCLLFLMGLLAYVRPVLVERLAPWLSGAFLVTGYALTLFQAVDGAGAGALAIVAGALFGAGQGASFMGWLLVFSRMGLDRAALSMAASTLLSAVLLLVIGFMPSVASLFGALLAVVIGCCGLLFWCLRADAGGPAVHPALSQVAHAPVEREAVYRRDGGVWLKSWVFMERRALLCLLAIAFVCGAQRVISLEGFLSQGATRLLFSAGYVVGTVGFLAAWRVAKGDGGYYRTYTLLLAIMATCGAFSFIQNSLVQTTLYTIDNVAFTIVSICMVMMAISAAEESRYSPLVLGGVVCGTMYFAIQLGRIVCNVVTDLMGIGMMSALVISVIIIYVLALAAITSGVFLRQVASVGVGDAGGPGGPDGPGLAGAREGAGGAATVGRAGRTVISIASVTEGQLRSNPVYRRRYAMTEREIDVLALLLAGYNASDIAGLLGISANTVKTHLKNIYAKAGVHNRRELIALLNEVEGQGGGRPPVG